MVSPFPSQLLRSEEETSSVKHQEPQRSELEGGGARARSVGFRARGFGVWVSGLGLGV